MHSLAPKQKPGILFPSARKALADLDRLAHEVENAPSLKALDAMIEDARDYQRKFKDVFAVSARAGRVWIIAECKLGAELAEIPKAIGTRGQIKSAGPGRGKTGGVELAPPVSDAPTLKELGVERKRAARAHSPKRSTCGKFRTA